MPIHTRLRLATTPFYQILPAAAPCSTSRLTAHRLARHAATAGDEPFLRALLLRELRDDFLLGEGICGTGEVREPIL
jgi:hypothetical protein